MDEELRQLRIRKQEYNGDWHRRSLMDGTLYTSPAAQASREQDRQELMRLLIQREAGVRMSLKAIAKVMGRSYVYVCRLARTPGFLDELKELSKDSFAEVDAQIAEANRTLPERLEELQTKALDTLEQLMDSRNEGIALRAADSALDRAEGTAKNTKADVKQTFKLEANVLMHAARTALELEGQ